MKKLYSAVLILTLLLTICHQGVYAQIKGQEAPPRFEVGVQIFGSGGRDLSWGWGGGARVSYNLTRHFAIDTEWNAFLEDEGDTIATQVFAGLKIGDRDKQVGGFIKIRPGFIINHIESNFGEPKTRFALDLGVVAEYYLNRHLAFRWDISDVIIPYGNDLIRYAGESKRPGITHNLHQSLGISIRF